MVLKDIMAARQSTGDVDLQYYRIPITAERPPDFADLSELIEVVLRTSTSTPIVVNCQLGRGRSTLASVCSSCCYGLSFLKLCLDHPTFDSAMAGNASSRDCIYHA